MLLESGPGTIRGWSEVAAVIGDALSVALEEEESLCEVFPMSPHNPQTSPVGMLVYYPWWTEQDEANFVDQMSIEDNAKASAKEDAFESESIWENMVEDPVENIEAKFVRLVVAKTNELVGDEATLLPEGIKFVAVGVNHEVGNMIAEVMSKVGWKGVVILEEGLQFDRFVTDSKKMSIEYEICKLLNSYEFPGDDVPIVSGSSLLVLEALMKYPSINRREDKWIYELMDSVDNYIPIPTWQLICHS